MNSPNPDFPAETEHRPVAAVVEYVEQNPVGAILQALAFGFVIGLIIRWIEGPREKKSVRDIDLDHKPSLEEAKFHLGALLLPFLWPAWQKARGKCGESAESIQEAVAKLKKSDLAKIGKKKALEAAKWADREAGHLSKTGHKTKKQILEWLEQEAADLAKTGGKKAKQVEEWVEEEVLPTVGKGWGKLRKFLS